MRTFVERLHRFPRALLATGLGGLLVAGCVSVRTLDPVPLADGGAGVELRVFASDSARRAGVPSPRHVESLLEQRIEGEWVPVFRSLDPAWRVDDLEPGRYRLSLPSVLDPEGRPVPIEDARTAFRVRSGELARVEGNLDHVPRAAITAGVVGAVIAGVVLHDWIEDLDLPDPPHELLDAAFHVTVELAIWSGVARGPGPAIERPPVVTSVFPEADALVAAPWVRIVLAFSEPLAAVEPDAVRVVADETGELAGRASWDPEHWWLVWEPAEDLPRGETIRFELDPDGVRDRAGNALAAPVESSFRTTP